MRVSCPPPSRDTTVAVHACLNESSWSTPSSHSDLIFAYTRAAGSVLLGACRWERAAGSAPLSMSPVDLVELLWTDALETLNTLTFLVHQTWFAEIINFGFREVFHLEISNTGNFLFYTYRFYSSFFSPRKLSNERYFTEKCVWKAGCHPTIITHLPPRAAVTDTLRET